MRSRICLNMIVRNEAHCLRDCLESVLPLVDRWVVVDTGSTDGTQELVREVLAGLPGELHERPWVDFGHNRQEALTLARESPEARPGDYLLTLDADEHLDDLPEDGLELSEDGYFVDARYAGTAYGRLAFARLDAPWRWVSPIHEYLDLPGAGLGRLERPVLVVESRGARSRDTLTYFRDADLLERELAAAPDDPRLQFYFAQSLRDSGQLLRAVTAYRTRVGNDAGWDQERWYAQYQIGLLQARLHREPAEVAAELLAAHELRPWRAEPLVALARLERAAGRPHVALLYAEPAAALPRPDGEIFVETDLYSWGALDELAVSAFWAGRYADGEAAAARALAVRPDDERLRANLAFFRDRPAPS